MEKHVRGRNVNFTSNHFINSHSLSNKINFGWGTEFAKTKLDRKAI